MSAPPLPAIAAAAPLVLLGALVLRSRASLTVSAWGAAGAAAALAVWPFRLPAASLLAAASKGLWTGAWILLIVVPALLLYEVTERSGALGRLSDEIGVLAPTPGRRLLLLAWVFPSFVQGAAGFGTPIAVAAPMLVRSGLEPVEAVAACLLGYHWSVTFGSMGSSFFIASATANLSDTETARFALRTAVLLSVNCLAAGLLLLRRVPDGGGREAFPVALALAALMSAGLVIMVTIQPALGSTGAGLAGLLASLALLPRRDAAPDRKTLLVAAAPYLLLALSVGVGFGVPGIRTAFEGLPELAPSFASSHAAYGHVTPAVDAHQPFRLLLHPAPYLLASAGMGLLLYRRTGWWEPGTGGEVVRLWVDRCRHTVGSVVALTVLAGLMVEAGMAEALSNLLASTLGSAYTALAAAVGALGTVMTGSTAASNALLAPLQAAAAEQLGIERTVLLAAQGAGGNVGNILAPVTILVGAVAAGGAGLEGHVIRRNWRDAAVLLGLVVTGVVIMALSEGGG